MSDLRRLRRERLETEYTELVAFSRKSNGAIQITPQGSAPYEKYTVVFNIRTIVSPRPTYSERTECILSIPPNYPDGVPTLMAVSQPLPWNVNWFVSGNFCPGSWDDEHSLAGFLFRAARVLQYHPEYINIGSPANADAISFWTNNLGNSGIIPCDTTALPDPSGLDIEDEPPPKPRSSITVKGRSQPQPAPQEQPARSSSRIVVKKRT